MPDRVLHERYRHVPTRVEYDRAVRFHRHHYDRFAYHHARPIYFEPYHYRVFRRVYVVPETYYYRRHVFYTRYAWSPPVYVYNMYPRYGLWDSIFLAFMLDNIVKPQYALMYYNQRYNPDMMLWRQTMDQQAANDPALQYKLSVLDQQVAQLEAAGTPVDPEYVPPDAADIALAADVVQQYGSGGGGGQ